MISRFLNNLKRSTIWFFRMFKIYPWDYDYLLIVIQYYLSDMYDYMEKYSTVKNKERILKELKICQLLIERQISCSNLKGPLGKEITFKLAEDENSSITCFRCQNSSAEFRRINDFLVKKEKYDLYYLFNLMSRKIKTWRD